MNSHTNICVDIYFISLGQIPSARIAEVYGKFLYHLLRNYQIILQSDCAILNSHQQCIQ